MYLHFIVVGLLSTTVNAYILLQVSKDDQNRSNVDALIHKVVRSQQFDDITAKIAKIQLPNKGKASSTKAQKNESKKAVSLGNKIGDSVQNLLDKKPVFKTRSFEIKPTLIHFRSQPSVVYKVDSHSIIRAMEDILASKNISQYAEDMARKAVFVYRSIKDNK